MSHDLDGEGQTQHDLAALSSTGWREVRRGRAKLSRGGVQMGKWKRRGPDRKRDGVSARDK